MAAVASILVSEVEPDVRRLFTVLIERMGHVAIVLRDDVAVPPRADVLLVDPVARSSVERLLLVRASFPELPVVCFNLLPDSIGPIGRGPVFFLPKPFAPIELETILDRALAGAASPV